jgi:hypothetical protein
MDTVNNIELKIKQKKMLLESLNYEQQQIIITG